MKKRVCLLIAIIVCFCMIGCTSDAQEQRENFEVDKQEVITDFLVEFFNFNCNGRYDTLMGAIENDDSLVDVNTGEEGIAPITQVQEQALETYYEYLTPCVTEECLETMQANRLPVQLDKFTKEKGIEASIDYIELTEYDENTYSYRVHFEEIGDAYFTDGLAGQVSYEVIGDEVKISGISIVQ